MAAQVTEKIKKCTTCIHVELGVNIVLCMTYEVVGDYAKFAGGLHSAGSGLVHSS